jgi:hypothetical protein
MWKWLICGLLVAVVLVGYVVAQRPMVTPDNPRTTPYPSNATKEGQIVGQDQWAQHFQQSLATCLLLGNQEQILINDFAVSRLQNADVKKFATTLANNSKEAVAKLQRFAPNAPNTEMIGRRVSGIRLGMSEGVIHPVAWDEGYKSDVTGAPSAANAAVWDKDNPMKIFSTIQQSAVENCIALTQHEFTLVDKNMIDHAYLAQQFYTNVTMLAKLRAIEPYVTGDLKTIVDNSLKTVQANMDEAKNLCKKLQGNTTTNVPEGSY